jgi:uncharacterized membrane protein
MIKSISTILLTGFITILPIVLTIYLLYWMAITSEELLGSALRWALPSVIYFPGLGTIAGVLLIFLVGLLMKAVLVRQVFSIGENIVFRLPVIKTVYRAIRDFFDFFSPKKESFGRVVIVKIGNMEAIGFVTQEEQEKLPEAFRDRDCVLVYLPMSYMIGGYTLLVHHENIIPCKMSMDEAMRFVLTAGITGKDADSAIPSVEKA